MTHIFDCSVCLDNITQMTVPKTILNNLICYDCSLRLVPEFEAALASESEYPVCWANTPIPAADFADMLGDELVHRYQQREIEYKTPLADRVYCNHQMVAAVAPPLGSTPVRKLALNPEFVLAANHFGVDLEPCGAMSANRTEASSFNVPCYHCLGLTCRTCEQPDFSDAPHVCRPTQQAHDALAGQVRGRDYQICPGPSCGYIVNLMDACNYLICPIAACQTGFCYICGKVTEHYSNHWAVGNPCPKWNQPGSEHAVYDKDGNDNADEDGNDIADYDDPWDDTDSLFDPDVDELVSYLVEDHVANGGGEPLLVAPSAGATWLDDLDESLDNEVNANLFGKQLVEEVDLLDQDALQDVSLDDLLDLYTLLWAQLQVWFSLYRVEQLETREATAELLTHAMHLSELDSELIRDILRTNTQEQITRAAPKLAQALAFYDAHKNEVADAFAQSIAHFTEHQDED